MTSNTSSPPDTLSQLESARTLALGDATFYPDIVHGVLPIIGPSASRDQRRWGADFLAETFASPNLGADKKQDLAIGVLETFRDLLEIPGEDTPVIKSVVQAATSIYPLIFRYIISNPKDTPRWQLMAAVKSNILRRMDSASAGVKVCCVKFIQRVVHVQTPGLIADPRRPEKNELSLSLVPRDHPLIPPPTLEAEASGLLDRLLSVFQENVSDALLVTATLNSIGILVRTRATLANKIILAILNFNPLKNMNAPLIPRTRVAIRSMERTVKSFLMNINKRNPGHPLYSRVQSYLEQMPRSWIEVLEETNRKRSAPSDPRDDESQTKRQRFDSETFPQIANIPQLPPGPTSFAQLFTLTTEPLARDFDITSINIDIVNQILVPILISLDTSHLHNAINTVRSRYLSLTQPHSTTSYSATSMSKASVGTDFDEEYEPDDDLQSSNVPHTILDHSSEVILGPFRIPQPPRLSGAEVIEYGKGMINRVFGMISDMDENSSTKTSKLGFNRLAASQYDRDSWFTIISRLATRATAGLGGNIFKDENNTETSVARNDLIISRVIRDTIFMYIISDFRRRIDVAISWLSEEWYNDQILSRSGEDFVSQYEKCAVRLLEGILPYLDAKDKILIRFLSEIPEINRDLLERVKRLAQDPERVSLAVNAIHYLILFRPPARELCIDALEDLYRNYDDAKAATTKLLVKWRPHVIEAPRNDVGDSKSPLPQTTALVAR